MTELPCIGNEPIVKRTVDRDGFHAKGVAEKRVEKILDDIDGQNGIENHAFLFVVSPRNATIRKREIEQAHDHKVHAYKINVAANSREKFVLGKDKYQISDDGDNEGKLQIRNRLRDALA